MKLEEQLNEINEAKDKIKDQEDILRHMRFYLESNGIDLEAAGNDNHAWMKIL